MLLGLLGLSAVTLDVGVLGNQTVGPYMINLLRPEARGRINAIYLGAFFVGGAIGSTAAGMPGLRRLDRRENSRARLGHPSWRRVFERALGQIEVVAPDQITGVELKSTTFREIESQTG